MDKLATNDLPSNKNEKVVNTATSFWKVNLIPSTEGQGQGQGTVEEAGSGGIIVQRQ